MKEILAHTLHSYVIRVLAYSVHRKVQKEVTLSLGQELQLSLGTLIKCPSQCITAENRQRKLSLYSFPTS